MKIHPVLLEVAIALLIAILGWVAFSSYKAGQIEERLNTLKERSYHDNQERGIRERK